MKHVEIDAHTSVLRGVFGLVIGVETPEEKWLKKRPYLRMTPVFSENISRVGFTGNAVKGNESGSNSLSNTMESEHSVPFVELGVRTGRTVHNRFVVANM